MKEADLGRAIQIALTREGARVFRNETGSYKTASGTWISYGLCVGSADLVGWTGEGKFLAIETKSKVGKTTQKQRNFLDRINFSGGVAFVARSVQEAVEKYRKAKGA